MSKFNDKFSKRLETIESWLVWGELHGQEITSLPLTFLLADKILYKNSHSTAALAYMSIYWCFS